MFSFLSSDSDNDSTNNDDGDNLAEPISSPSLTTDVNTSESCSISKRNLLQMFGKHLASKVYDAFSKSYLSTSLTFDQTRSSKALVELIVGNDLPFSFAEYSGLNVFVKGLNSDFKLCSILLSKQSSNY